MRLAVALLAAAVTAASVAPRILLASGALPDVLRPFVWSDPLFVYARSLSGHRLPYLDGAFEYPPLVGALSALFSLVSESGRDLVLLWGAVQIGSAATAAWILAELGDPRVVRGRFALAPQLLLLGGLNFDLLAVAFVVLGLGATVRTRPLRSATALGLGAATKLFPLAAAPVAVLRATSPARAAAVLAAVLAASYLPASLAGASAAAGPLYYFVGIEANLDSPWGLIARVAGALGVRDAQRGIALLTLAGMAIGYVAVVLPRARRADATVAFALAIVTVLVWSRLYSPQYSLWVLPFFALLPLPRRLFGLLTLGDLVVFATIGPLTLVPWEAGDPLAATLLAVLVTGVVLRTAALLLTGRALLQMAPRT